MGIYLNSELIAVVHYRVYSKYILLKNVVFKLDTNYGIYSYLITYLKRKYNKLIKLVENRSMNREYSNSTYSKSEVHNIKYSVFNSGNIITIF